MSQNGMLIPIPRSQILAKYLFPSSISRRHPTTQCPSGKSDVQKDQKMDRDLQVAHHVAGLQKFQSQVHLPPPIAANVNRKLVQF